MTRRGAFSHCLLAGLLAWAATTTAGEATKGVVLDFAGEDAGFDQQQRAQMSDRLSQVMADSGRYEVVDRQQFAEAVAAHEAETGQPCSDAACKRMVAGSLGAHVVQPKVERQGGGCAVSVGVMGGGGQPTAGGSVTHRCSVKGAAVSMDGAVLEMTHKIASGEKLPDLAEVQRQAAAAAPKEIEITTEAEEDQAELDAAQQGDGRKRDAEAEARAEEFEKRAAEELGW
jgi:hypothetical protein